MNICENCEHKQVCYDFIEYGKPHDFLENSMCKHCTLPFDGKIMTFLQTMLNGGKNIKITVEEKAKIRKYIDYKFILEKPITNYDKITESVESLAEHLVVSINMDLGGLRHGAGDGKLCATWEEAKQRTIEWLRKECEG